MAESVGRADSNESEAPFGFVDAIVLAAVNGLLVCRWLMPTEGAVLGDTLWTAQASIGVVALWCYAGFRAGTLRLRFGWIDAAVWLLVAGQVLSATVVLATSGDKRAALNMLWEWLGTGATYFLLRQILGTAIVRRTVTMSLLAVAVALSGLGFQQFQSNSAEMMADYLALKARLVRVEAELRRPGADVEKQQEEFRKIQWEFVRHKIPYDETARKMWEQRLKSSREPLAMFALTNTLAGVLLCGSLLWLAELGRTLQVPVRWRAVILTGLLSAGVVLCLILTKSRTGYVGLVAGAAVWIWLARRSPAVNWQRMLRAGGAGALIVAILAGVAWSSRGIDTLVLSQSGKSLRYRLEYWTSTWRMITESPRNFLLGVGPGNFRQSYLLHKLPESSEEVADPHNMILDVWGNGGLLALVGLTGICLSGFGNAIRPPNSCSVGQSNQQLNDSRRKTNVESRIPSPVPLLIVGGASAFGCSWLATGTADLRYAGLFAGWLATMLIFRRSLETGDVNFPAVNAAFAGLCIHLLGAGGIAMPAITQTLLLLLALGAEAFAPRVAVFQRPAVSVLALGVVCGLFAVCWLTATAPVMACVAHTADGEYHVYEKPDFAAADTEFQRACEADRLSAEPWEKRALLWFTSWKTTHSDVDFDRGVEFQKQALLRNPRSHVGYRVLGEWYFARSEKLHSRESAADAANALGEAVKRYPNSPKLLARVARAEAAAGRQVESQATARRALKLNAINQEMGHEDKILSESDRRRIESLLQEQSKTTEHGGSGIRKNSGAK